MTYTINDLLWLFFTYSFLGWCLEVIFSAFKRRKFVNRGFINSPLCTIYGFGSVLFAIFLPELTDSIFFLALGGGLLATVLEYATGMLMEKIFRRKLWDYSNIKFNIGGYVCLTSSALWALGAVITMLFTNHWVLTLFRLIPPTITVVIQWILVSFLLLDFLTTALSVLGMEITTRRLALLAEGMQQTSKLLENRLTAHVQKRMQHSFPSINREALVEDWKAKKSKAESEPKVFAAGCSFYKLFCLFMIGAFLGDIVETIFCLITSGVLMSRSSVFYGPFSIVWGLGCALLTLFLNRYRNKSDRSIFIAGTLLGGAYEFICSVFTELVFGTVFWDYSEYAFNLGGRINLLYCFFWGIAAVVWLKFIYPLFSGWIEKLPIRFGKIMCNCLIIFMIFNMIISSMALARYSERHNSPGDSEPSGAVVAFLDESFPDERMERIYPNAKMVE